MNKYEVIREGVPGFTGDSVLVKVGELHYVASYLESLDETVIFATDATGGLDWARLIENDPNDFTFVGTGMYAALDAWLSES